MNTVHDLQAILDRSPFVRQYGFRVESAAADTSTVFCPGRPDALRPDGIMSGPVFMAAADVAMWMAIIHTLGPDAVSAITVEMKTTFISALKGAQDFRCTANILKAGSRMVFGTADCRDLNGRVLTHHTMTYFRRDG
jgi:acyl-coenzyme A thioesterase PaaI-like protein